MGGLWEMALAASKQSGGEWDDEKTREGRFGGGGGSLTGKVFSTILSWDAFCKWFADKTQWSEVEALGGSL